MMKEIMSREDIDRAISRMTHQILERNQGGKNLTLIGIRTRGVPLAYRIARKIKEIEGDDITVGIIDITLYRDDLSKDKGLTKGRIKKTEIPFTITNKIVVLVDDVLYTGRSIRAALDALIDFGRPQAIWLAVLIDRGHREFPIQADFVGRQVITEPGEVVKVLLEEEDGQDVVRVYLPKD
jgi:pyrimidine operon attenuation protein/uracil phosphoribosyltransferase